MAGELEGFRKRYRNFAPILTNSNLYYSKNYEAMSGSYENSEGD